MMFLLSAFSFIAAFLYLHMGLYTYNLNKKSNICKLFLLFSSSMTIWSFAFGFMYIAATPLQYSFWNKISAFGWCTFLPIILYLVLLITESKLLNHWYAKFLVLLPAPVFLFMVLFLFGPDIKTSSLVNNLFYYGYLYYSLFYQLVSIFILYFWGKKSRCPHQKKQVNLIVLTASIPIILNFIVQTILPAFGINAPNVTQLFSLIMLWGIYNAIVKYHLLTIPTSLVTQELFNGLSGLALILSADGTIIKTNKQTYELLNFEENELLRKDAVQVLKSKEITSYLKHTEYPKAPVEFKEVIIISKTGEPIPFEITLAPLYDSKTNLFLGILIMGQDIRTRKVLESEIAQHKKTYDKLRNSEELFRSIIEIIPFSIVLTSKKDNKVLFANQECIKCFKMENSEIIGTNSYNYYKHTEFRLKLIEDLNQNKPVKERETIFLRSDGSEIIGLITMVSAVFQDQEVVLSCITDISEQRKLQQEVAKSEKMLNEFMHSIVDIVIVTELDGTITFANHSAEMTFRSSSSQSIVSRNILNNVVTEDLERAKEHMSIVVTANPGPLEYKSFDKNGKVFHAEVNATVLYDDNHAPTKLIFVIRNITERKMVELELKHNTEKIENMNLELLKINEMLKNKSIRDSLTNLYNHQYMNELLDEQIKLVNLSHDNLCVMMIDIDLFKRVNDTYGHQAGDKVLINITNLILQNTDENTMVGRYGGEEFIVILPNQPLEDAYSIAEKIRQKIETYDHGIANLKVTISIGLTEYRSEDGKTLVNRADSLLYQAKRNGRNRTEFLQTT